MNDLKNPACSKCGSKMVLRRRRDDNFEGDRFWGCSQFPKCQKTLPFKGSNIKNFKDVDPEIKNIVEKGNMIIKDCIEQAYKDNTEDSWENCIYKIKRVIASAADIDTVFSEDFGDIYSTEDIKKLTREIMVLQIGEKAILRSQLIDVQREINSGRISDPLFGNDGGAKDAAGSLAVYEKRKVEIQKKIDGIAEKQMQYLKRLNMVVKNQN